MAARPDGSRGTMPQERERAAVTRAFAVAAAAAVCIAALASAAPLTSPSAHAATAQPAPAAATPRPGASLPNEGTSVKFGVIGDTGTGGSAQYAVAKLLAEARATFPFDFVIMLGDNMYGGEKPSDFLRKFERPYKPLLDARVPFYATLGNHDDPAQRFYQPFNMGGERYYTFRRGDVEFFVLDSTHMTDDQVAWLERELARSNARWKIAYCHHPLYSSGERHGSDLALQRVIEPLFLKYGVDVAFAGHEHFYERLKPQQGIAYFIAGGSAKLRKNNINDRSPLTDKGFDTDNSFMLVEIGGDRLSFETVSRRGQVIDQGTLAHR